MNKTKPNILLIYTGGTIGMIKDHKTGVLRAFDFKHLLKRIPELQLLDCKIDTVSFQTPIDSSNMNPDYWLQIADCGLRIADCELPVVRVRAAENVSKLSSSRC